MTALDPRWLAHYRQELLHLRESAAAFAAAHPQMAGRLALDPVSRPGECRDPAVERLLEGFAFLAARIHLRLDTEFEQFTQHLLERVCPTLLAPTPSMLIAAFEPDVDDADLARGVEVARGSALVSPPLASGLPPCRFVTAHAVRLWPLRVAEVRCRAVAGAVDRPGSRISVALQVGAGLRAAALPLDELVLHLAGDDLVALRLHEHLLAGCDAIEVVDPARPESPVARLPPTQVRQAGLADDEALLPAVAPGLNGHRLLKEYAALPARALFVRICGLRPAMAALPVCRFELQFSIRWADSLLERCLNATHLRLHCTPAINLFPMRMDRVEVDRDAREVHLVVDRSRPRAHEIISLRRVTGLDASGRHAVRELRPSDGVDGVDGLDSLRGLDGAAGDAAAGATGPGAIGGPAIGRYAIRRVPRVASRQMASDAPAGYVGSELYLSLADATEPPWPAALAQLEIDALCSQRAWPLQIAVGRPDDLLLDAAGPLRGARILRGPSPPVTSPADGPLQWRLISHLSLNFRALADPAGERALATLLETLALHGIAAHSPAHACLRCLVSLQADAAVCRLPVAGPLAYGRGTRVRLGIDEARGDSAGLLLFGEVLEQFLARHTHLNSFTQLELVSPSRGLLKRWPPRLGAHPTT